MKKEISKSISLGKISKVTKKNKINQKYFLSILVISSIVLSFSVQDVAGMSYTTKPFSSTTNTIPPVHQGSWSKITPDFRCIGLMHYSINQPQFVSSLHVNSTFGIAVDQHCNIYITDNIDYHIKKIDINGNVLKSWVLPLSPMNEIFAPSGIAVDSSGNVFVTSISSDSIYKYDSNTKLLKSWKPYGSISGYTVTGEIAVDSSGYVYVITGDNLIQKFDNNGNFITILNIAPVTLFNPSGIAVDQSGNIYVTDLNSVKIFSSSGTPINTLGGSSSGSTLGKFNYALGIAIDQSDDVYVVDSNNNRIQKWNHISNSFTTWGQFGSADGEFNHPTSIAVDSSGDIYVADVGNNHRIEIFAYTTNDKIMNNVTPTIPSWMKKTANMWCKNQIDDKQFLQIIENLVKNKIIHVPNTSSSIINPVVLPWFKSDTCNWSTGKITDLQFLQSIDYLIMHGIIKP